MKKENQIKIGLVDDEILIISLLSDFFANHPKIDVVLTAANGEQLFEQLKSGNCCPDILLLDLQMKEMNGLESIGKLRSDYPQIKIIVVSSHYRKNFMGYMMKLGVNAFLPKGIYPQELSKAICEVDERGFFFLEEQIEVMRSQISSAAPSPNLTSEESLTEREIEVLHLICQQCTAQEIADKLFISKRTVEGHRNNLLLKTSAKNSAGLVMYAIQKRLIHIDQCFFID